MTGWRSARPDELTRLWPAFRSAHVLSSAEDLRDIYTRRPWCVRVSEDGDAMLLRPWRAQLDALAIRLVVAPEHRMPALLEEARAVARAQGYGRIVSPLVPASRLRAYTDAGMDEVRPIVALQGTPQRVSFALHEHADATVRLAQRADVDALLRLDAECFDEFWRHGREEFDELFKRERLTVADCDGSIVGYASCSSTASACTVGRLGVSPDARRRGIGQALLRDAAAWARSQGAGVLSLCTQEQNAASRALYRKAGLVEVEEPYAVAVGPSGGNTHEVP